MGRICIPKKFPDATGPWMHFKNCCARGLAVRDLVGAFHMGLKRQIPSAVGSVGVNQSPWHTEDACCVCRLRVSSEQWIPFFSPQEQHPASVSLMSACCLFVPELRRLAHIPMVPQPGGSPPEPWAPTSSGGLQLLLTVPLPHLPCPALHRETWQQELSQTPFWAAFKHF